MNIYDYNNNCSFRLHPSSSNPPAIVLETNLKVKEELKGLLSNLNEDIALEISKLFEKDLENNSPRLNSKLQSLVLKATTEGKNMILLHIMFFLFLLKY